MQFLTFRDIAPQRVVYDSTQMRKKRLATKSESRIRKLITAACNCMAAFPLRLILKT